jgi:hypothetical protein
MSSATRANSAATASPTVPATSTSRSRRSGTARMMRLTRSQERGVAAIICPRETAASVVSSRSARVLMKATTAGCSPRGTA